MTEQNIEELIRKYAEGTASTEEVQKLMNWYRSSSPGMVQWPSAEAFEKEIVSRRMLLRLKDQISPKHGGLIHLQWRKIAAILVVFLGVATILIFSLRSSSTSLITVTNPSGKIQTLTLPDSSRVWLNATTVIQYPRSFRQHRRVMLEGEGYFEVTHDAGHPFVVEAGGLNTTVLGTSFNVQAFAAGTTTKISVVRGRVKVTDHSKELGVLSASNELKFDRRASNGVIAPIDTNHVLAWKNGKLKFEGESFADIAIVLESWYNIKIKFEDTSVAKCRYYMSLENTTPADTLLTLLSKISEINYEFNREKTEVKIYGKGCPGSER